MANYEILKAAIRAVIKENANNEITGDLLQQALISMINSLGVGSRFMGIATPSTNPGTPDQDVFYIASTSGSYTNFDGIVVAENEIAILKYNGTWTKDVTGAASALRVDAIDHELRKYFGLELYGVFQRGSLSNGELIWYDSRVATNTIMSYPTDIVLSVSQQYKFGVHTFVNGVFSNDSGWQTGDCAIPKNTHFKVVIAKRDEDGNPADVNTFVEQVTLGKTIIQYMSDDIDYLKQKIVSRLPLDNSNIVVGSLSPEDNGYYQSFDCLVDTVFYPVGGGSIKVFHADDILIRVNQYSKEKNIISTTGAYSDIQTVQLNPNTRFVRLSASYYQRGYSEENPITKNAFNYGDFGIEYTVEQIAKTLVVLSNDENSDYELYLNRYFVGCGATYSDTIVRGLVPGRKYAVILKTNSWNVSGLSGNQFAISNWVNDSYTILAQYQVGGNIQQKTIVTIPDNSDYVAIGGRAQLGYKVYFNIFDVTDILEEVEKTYIKSQKVTDGCGYQGLTKIGNIIVQFNPSADNHSSYAEVLRWDSSFNPLSDMTHNLGHAATVDYNEEMDALVIGNGSSDTSVKPRIDIILNASTVFSSGGQVSYSGSNVIHIELSTNVKEIGGSGLIATFGGNGRELYLATGQDAPRKFFRCILGVGTNDFSDNTAGQNDVTAWGQYISGKADNEYNGTLKVISTYIGEETSVYQGMCYRNGYVYLACGYESPLIHKVKFFTNVYKIVQTNLPAQLNGDGTIQIVEPEGLCFFDDNTMLVGLPAYGGLYKISAF